MYLSVPAEPYLSGRDETDTSKYSDEAGGCGQPDVPPCRLRRSASESSAFGLPDDSEHEQDVSVESDCFLPDGNGGYLLFSVSGGDAF